MIIRAMKPTELDDVLEMWVEMCSEAGSAPSRVMWVQNTVALLTGGSYGILVAEDDGKIIGFIDHQFIFEPAESGLIGIGRHLFVKPEYRKKGVGKKLVDEVMIVATARGAKKAYLQADFAAKVVWERHGYAPRFVVFEAVL